jgi:hypothetical protein
MGPGYSMTVSARNWPAGGQDPAGPHPGPDLTAGLDALAAGYVHGVGRRGILVCSQPLADGVLSTTGSIRAAFPSCRL